MKIKLTYLAVFFIQSIVLAQVGINTTNPQNDLHVNGGVRINDLPAGSDLDGQTRLLASDADGNIVRVSNKLPTAIAIPQLVFNAQFGGSKGSGATPFFSECSACSNNTDLRLNLNDEVIRVSSPLLTVEDPDTGVPSDEYFLINEGGIFRFEINFVTSISDNKRWLINLKINVVHADGSTDVDSIRAYAGKPDDIDSSSSVGSFIAVPIYVTDTRNYDLGDHVYMEVEVVRAGASGAKGNIRSSLPTNATYKGQITVTKY